MATDTMAKKKSKPRDQLVAIRCSEAWKAWLEGVAKAERVTPTQLIDKCLAEWTVANGHKGPPDR